jgi:N-acetylglucosaminyl-diphospho-decaprenol L-rhamnosyltransferase
VRPAIYIPNFNGAAQLGRALRGLAAQTVPAEVVVVDNGSHDDSLEVARRELPAVRIVEIGRNIGFGPALNRAVAAHPAEALILLNNDAEPEPRFVEALLDGLGSGVDAVAGVLLQEREPELIDSAGVVADAALMGFDYLHGEPASAAETAPDPLGASGGAALYRRAAFEAVGGFDERIFLYYEDLDLALRMRAAGYRCRLARGARGVHAYSATLGANSGRKYEMTGWSRGFLLRLYGFGSRPGALARAIAVETVICAGQLLGARTARGIYGRIAGWKAAKNLPRRPVPPDGLLEIGAGEALSIRRRRHAG